MGPNFVTREQGLSETFLQFLINRPEEGNKTATIPVKPYVWSA
jgi:hypothetical protein